MSKKKSSTMTMSLKDFHGGSIPSDLPLPSAPASSSAAPTRWGPSQTRPDPLHRPRPGSAGSASSTTSGGAHRILDVRGPPLFSTTNIGRNFDDEERKPFESSFPRRVTLSDPIPRSAAAPVIGSSRPDPKLQQPQPPVRSATGANVWGTKKELRHVQDLTMESSIAVEDLPARFAQASAIEKVSSGRWQSKQLVMPPTATTQSNAEVIRVRETGRVLEEEAKEISPGSPSEVKEFGERPSLKFLPRIKVAVDANEVRGFDEKQGSMNMLRPGSAGENVSSQISERPRLNLKPRSLPVEGSHESIERERKSVFGGARPRELVLKERGIDDVEVSDKPTEWRPETETWRKTEAPSGGRVGKASSPMELARAFSRSASDVRIDRVQVPFSRLTNTRDFYAGPNPSRQINGFC